LDFPKRRRQISEKISKQELDFVAITTEPNLRYFFNYAGHSFERFCCGLISQDGTRTALIIPKLDVGKAEKSNVDDVFSWADNDGYRNALMKAVDSIKRKDSGKIACEEALRLGQIEQLKEALRIQDFVPITSEIASLRLIKSDEEMNSIRDCATRLAKAYKDIPEIVKEGISESEVAFEIMKILSKQHLENSEPPLVQSGTNSAIPHSTPSAKKIHKGEMVVVDASCPNEDGYFADFTRTYSIGKASQKQREVYEVVRKAQEAGTKTAQMGTAAKEVDRVTRFTIEKAGYGKYFFHRTGHGLGLEVHEEPWVRDGNASKLEPGMVFTVEPGIYLANKFGVRIEDNVIIGHSKSENITPLDHELIEI
jgi:Xaa-Pro dipeptidase